MAPAAQIVDLGERALRDGDRLKWGIAEPDVLAAWVAEMDFELAPVLTAALKDAVSRGITGYPPPDRLSGVAEALCGFARRRWDWDLDDGQVILVGDVMSGMALALTTLCEDAPVVVPTPVYPPLLAVAGHTGRELVPVPLSPDDQVASLDLERIEAALRAGARTVLLCNPQNPWGRAFTRPELEALRDTVEHHGARVVSDEIHAPLVLPGSEHVPYASLQGAAQHTTTVLAASKAWNLPGLKCAQIVTGSEADARVLRGLPLIANHSTSPLGIVAARTAYELGEPWLDALLERLAANRALFTRLMAAHVPGATMRPMEATFLAWVDARSYDLDNPARTALELGRVLVNDGRTFGPGGQGHVRVNLATSATRIEQIVDRLAIAWEPHDRRPPVETSY
jgi:cysteine-S-conjugate beta-lyase